jgi:hypothetical protein
MQELDDDEFGQNANQPAIIIRKASRVVRKRRGAGRPWINA